jgi:hypothetical protein
MRDARVLRTQRPTMSAKAGDRGGITVLRETRVISDSPLGVRHQLRRYVVADVRPGLAMLDGRAGPALPCEPGGVRPAIERRLICGTTAARQRGSPKRGGAHVLRGVAVGGAALVERTTIQQIAAGAVGAHGRAMARSNY